MTNDLAVEISPSIAYHMLSYFFHIRRSVLHESYGWLYEGHIPRTVFQKNKKGDNYFSCLLVHACLHLCNIYMLQCLLS